MSFRLARLESYKYPRQVRYFYPTAVVSDEPDHLIIYHAYQSPIWDGKRNRLERFEESGLNILFPNRDYNVCMWWNADGSFNTYYINIAMPMEWDGELCSYIDLDLDVLWVTPHSNRLHNRNYQEPGVYVLDREEYEENKVIHGYAPEFMERIEKALQAVLEGIEQRTFPFDDSLLHFQPTPTMLELADLPDTAALWHIENEA